MTRRVLVVAGDVSGDMHAAALVRAARAQDGDLAFFGIGGDALRAEGVDILYDCADMSVFGLPEVLKRYRFFRRVFDDMVALVRERRPDAVLLVDYGGFNIRFAERVHALGCKVLYYISPQVWASRRGRIQRMARCIDRLMVIFPFEVQLFEEAGLRADFVGHPLVDAAREALAAPPADLPWRGAPRVALLPGSRKQEVERILPALAGAVDRLRKQDPGAAFLIAAPNRAIAEQARALWTSPVDAEVVVGRTREVLKQADAAIVASGTATVEAALMKCPMVVVYKTSWAFYALARMLVRVKHIGMVNVVAGRCVCPELVQSAATPSAIADAVTPLLSHTPQRASMLNALGEVVALLGEGGAAENAAAILLEELKIGVASGATDR